MTIAITTSQQGDRTVLGFCEKGGPCGAYPLRPFYVELPNGMRHHFISEHAARASQYWPQRTEVREYRSTGDSGGDRRRQY